LRTGESKGVALTTETEGGYRARRFGQSGAVAAVVAFLADPDAAFITGATLDVTGGMNA
jgi:NAD(P)-dependent dehydrogenase (short-subunit alcohol dehydrogenase family)